MIKKSDIEESVFRLQMLTETFVVLEEAVEYTESELPRGFLHHPVKELRGISDMLKENLL